MNWLIDFRERLKDYYADYDVFIRPILRFVLALICLIGINNEIGYMEALNQIFVVLILAVICAILPLNGTVIVCAMVIVMHSMALSVETGVFAIVLYLLMVLLYLRFVPKDAFAVILVPVAFIFHVPAAVPIALGLLRGPVSSVSMILGLISWGFVQSLPEEIAPLISSDDSAMLDIIQAMPRALFTTKMLLLMIISVGVVLIVSVIKKFARTYNWETAIIAGAAIYLGLEIVGSIILPVDIDILPEILGTAVSILICFVIEFFNFSADYSKTEYLQFEDDHNYYYVKVTPKRTSEYIHSLDRMNDEENTDNIPSDDSHFYETEQNEVSRKFDGINLQSKLEESLKNLDANHNGRENAANKEAEADEAAGTDDDIEEDTPVTDSSDKDDTGDTKILM
ncbi:MAG: hypothetical protein SOI56_07690 [Eubacteriales bacterium]|jgi:hypothetical protein